MKPTFSPSASGWLSALAGAVLLVGQADAATLLDLDDLVRPPATGANTFLLGTGNDQPSTFSANSSVPSVTFSSQFGYLVVRFDTVTLDGIGDSVTFSYTAKFTNFDTSSNGVRIGLLHDGGTALTADQASTNLNSAGLYTGYVGLYRATSTTAGSLRRRAAGAIPQLLGGTALGGPLLSDTVSGFGIADASLYYSGSFSVVRTGLHEVTLISQFGDQAAQTAIDDTAGWVSSFNTLAFYTQRSGTTSATLLEFTGFSITTIPEPESVVLMLGSLGWLAWSLRARGGRPARGAR
ncbi:MAG TPA: hypothetical protein VNQ90_20345 [Chthoniobacteraceae bacterium]|nr:hypothetical protein [Chthoniobacteraceae bacterium]